MQYKNNVKHTPTPSTPEAGSGVEDKNAPSTLVHSLDLGRWSEENIG